MNKLIKLCLFILVISLLNGCSSKKTRIYKKQKHISLSKYKKSQIKKNTSQKHKNLNYKSVALYKQYKKWKGTKYKFGGTTKRGVDCSSFIQQVYFDAFGLKVPRTTSKQVNIGYKIDKNKLNAGDMIFFKNWRTGRHVGIMVEKGKFIHASTSRGVTISNIHNPYYKSNYWQSRRVLP